MRHITLIAFLALLCFSRPFPVAASSLFFSCGVPGAAVLVDSREAGTTDSRGYAYIDNIGPGAHTVAIVKDGYATHTESVAVKDKLTSFVTAAMKLQDTLTPEIMVLSPPSLRGIAIYPTEKGPGKHPQVLVFKWRGRRDSNPRPSA